MSNNINKVRITLIKGTIIVNNILDIIFNIPSWIAYHLHWIVITILLGVLYVIGGMNDNGDIEVNPFVGIGRVISRLVRVAREQTGTFVFLFIALIVVLTLIKGISRSLGNSLNVSFFATRIYKSREKIAKLEGRVSEVEKKAITVFDTIDDYKRSSNYENKHVRVLRKVTD